MQWQPNDAWTCSEEIQVLEMPIFDKGLIKPALERDVIIAILENKQICPLQIYFGGRYCIF